MLLQRCCLVMRLAKRKQLIVRGEGILLPVLSTNVTLQSELTKIPRPLLTFKTYEISNRVLKDENLDLTLAVMYTSRDRFVIPLTGTFCGNLISTKANFSPKNGSKLPQCCRRQRNSEQGRYHFFLTPGLIDNTAHPCFYLNVLES